MVSIEPTPNPNAMKFSVGKPVGGPMTFVAGKNADDPMAAALLELPGVTSVFATADFVTLSKSPEGSWDDIITPATNILEERFG
jgi:hypothetical protein